MAQDALRVLAFGYKELDYKPCKEECQECKDILNTNEDLCINCNNTGGYYLYKDSSTGAKSMAGSRFPWNTGSG